jgi:hypothetical protein
VVTASNQTARGAAASYRERMAEFAEMKVLDAWYATVNAAEIKSISGIIRTRPPGEGQFTALRPQLAFGVLLWTFIEGVGNHAESPHSTNSETLSGAHPDT